MLIDRPPAKCSSRQLLTIAEIAQKYGLGRQALWRRARGSYKGKDGLVRSFCKEFPRPAGKVGKNYVFDSVEVRKFFLN